MKPNPEYRPVAFRDTSTGDVMIIRSTVETAETIQLDGQTLPLYDLEVSSHSHPAYTVAARTRRESSRIEKFRRRYERDDGVAEKR